MVEIQFQECNVNGNINLEYYDDSQFFHIGVIPNEVLRLDITNQEQLSQGFYYAEKYKVNSLFLCLYNDNISLNFKDLDYIAQLKSIYFTTAGKNNSLDMLPKSCSQLDLLIDFSLISENPIEFNQFKAFTNLKKLTTFYHKNFLDWLMVESIVDLTVAKFKEDDLMSLKNLKSLKRLHLQKGSLKSLKGIGDLPNLETLYVDDLRYLTDVSNLADCKSLENIRFIPFKKVTDWDFLATMTQLKLIGLDVVDSVQFIEKLPNLVCIWCIKVKDKNLEILNSHQIKHSDTPVSKAQYNKAFNVKRYVEGH